MPDITDKLKHIKLLLLDVDGVLTDGTIIYNDQKVETKIFNVKDGLGIKLLMNAGIQVCIVTGRGSQALRHRCRDIGIAHVFENVTDKAEMLCHIVKLTGVSNEDTAFVGDDLPDLPLMKRVAVSFAVADAHEILRKHADMVTMAKGGRGAVREVSEILLKAGGHWEKVVEPFL